MARVIFDPMIQSISGTVGNLTFRTMNGKTFVHAKRHMPPGKDATAEERRKYRRAVLIDACVEILQRDIRDPLEAAGIRQKIYQRVAYHYDKLAPKVRSRKELQKRILEASRNTLASSPSHTDQITDLLKCSGTPLSHPND